MLTQTLQQLTDNVLRVVDAEGASARNRHPPASVLAAVNRGRTAFFRLVAMNGGGERTLTGYPIATIKGTSSYALPADFGLLASIDMVADGHASWLTPFQLEERSGLTDPSQSLAVPTFYRIMAESVELLPTPAGVYQVTLRYIPTPTALAAPADSFDTIAGFDEYIIYYAGRILAEKDKAWDVAANAKGRLDELREEIVTWMRMRDGNMPPRVVDVYANAAAPTGPFRRFR